MKHAESQYTRGLKVEPPYNYEPSFGIAGGKRKHNEVGDEIQPDGSIRPKRTPSRDPNNPNVYARPGGRDKKALYWDEKRGVWVPF
jgi:hypothetical protein